ncbi:MAG TPA: hypothetical protein VHA75_05340 [Rugosimonospora sp.]|nr:hypothetical protein [Rugosimonospora sp.]
MPETREIVIVMDMEKEAVRLWFERVLSQIRHPQYQGGIRVIGPVETTE